MIWCVLSSNWSLAKKYISLSYEPTQEDKNSVPDRAILCPAEAKVVGLGQVQMLKDALEELLAETARRRRERHLRPREQQDVHLLVPHFVPQFCSPPKFSLSPFLS